MFVSFQAHHMSSLYRRPGECKMGDDKGPSLPDIMTQQPDRNNNKRNGRPPLTIMDPKYFDKNPNEDVRPDNNGSTLLDLPGLSIN